MASLFMDFICLPDDDDSEEADILSSDEPEYPITPILKEVSKMVGINIKNVPSAFPTQSGPTPEQIKDLLTKQNVTFLKVCAPTYIACQSYITPLVAPSMMTHSHILQSSSSQNTKETPMYYSVFVSSKNITVNDLKTNNLKNKLICAVNDVHSLSGYHCIRLWLNKHNLMASNCPFSHIIISGSHLNSLKLIENGVADIAAIDIFILLPWILKLSEQEKQASSINILDKEILGPHHSQILCIDNDVLKNNKHLTIKKLQNAFVRASHFKHIQDYMKKEMMVQSFVNVDHKELNRLQTVLAQGSYIIKLLKHYYFKDITGVKRHETVNNAHILQTEHGIFELALASFDDIDHNRFVPIDPFPAFIRQNARYNVFNKGHVKGTSSLQKFVNKFVDQKYDDGYKGVMMKRMVSNFEHHHRTLTYINDRFKLFDKDIPLIRPGSVLSLVGQASMEYDGIEQETNEETKDDDDNKQFEYESKEEQVMEHDYEDPSCINDYLISLKKLFFHNLCRLD